MSETRVVHVNDKSEGAVYIGRPIPRRKLAGPPFANPHKIKDERQLCIDMYEVDITEGPLRPLLADLPALRGKPLACWCRRDGEPVTDDNRCHGDVLVELLETYTDDELIAMVPLFDVQSCRVCGCTEDRACEGGCYWIEPDLCSACAKADGVPDPLPEWRVRQLLMEQGDRLSELEEAYDDLINQAGDAS
jgi:hypothetical protein